ncbi:MAG: isovaleryl-CoA dehydrogenase [Solirubrobacterales bacterium]|jgi:isovaleryl-CoA dehydrogenase|nr:isovaleryl-CoA dehydrogenase [Solirubrobacterales bacterium]
MGLPRSAELGLSDEQLLLRRTVRQFAQEKVAPRARALDAEQGFPRESWEEAAGLGLLGTTVAEEDGGAGLGLTELCLIGEELGAVCISTAATVLHQADMVVGRIARHGDAGQKQRWLPGLIDGSLIGCLAMTEAEAGSDVMSMRTRAERLDGGGWRLNGTKTFITNGPVADLALIYARTPEAGERALGLFAVPTEAPGLSRGKKFSKMGWRGSPTGELMLDECEVGADALLGAPDGGRAILLNGLDSERVLMAAESVGLAQGALEVALAYAGQRRQFGKPIGEFQLVGAKLADMFAETEAARALTRSLAARIDAGESSGLRALASACKLLGGDLAMRVTSEAVQVLGGYGYIDEFPVERFMRDAKLMQIGGGTAEIQRYVIARELLA